MLKTPRTVAAGIAAAAVIVGGAFVAGSAAQAAPTSTTPAAPGATVKTVTLCVSAPAHDTFKQSRVEAWSWQKGIYSLDSVQVTNKAGCGTVVLGSTGHVHFSAIHVSSVRVRPHLCTVTTYRADLGTKAAASVTSGSTLTGKLRFVRRSTFRC
ncbi:MAG TPA: hypothetical protein VIC82_11615 [Candidatus Nanopelagicales bacterium]|jgi:hypothetical protein